MGTTIDAHCETALDSPYSRDRRDAIEQLGRLYPSASTDEQTRILETLREVAFDSSSRNERELARSQLSSCFETDTTTGEAIVVDTFCELAMSAKFSEERLDAIDALRKLYPNTSEQRRDGIGQTLAEIAGNATYDDERRRARQRLSDISREERQEPSSQPEKPAEEVCYLGSSLAEHLAEAAHDGAEECLQRAEEVSEFLDEHPLSDAAYEDVRADVDSLVTQLNIVPTGETLDEDRIQRIERIAERVERLYIRSELS